MTLRIEQGTVYEIDERCMWEKKLEKKRQTGQSVPDWERSNEIREHKKENDTNTTQKNQGMH